MTVILLRHGRSTSNTAGVLAGRSEGVDLDDKGREQAAGLIDRIGELPIRAVVCSPMLRCRRTVGPLAEALCLEPLIDDRLSEVDYGEWTGRKIGELAKEPLWRVVQAHPSAAVFPGGEGLAQVQARAVAAVREHDRRLALEYGGQYGGEHGGAHDGDVLWLACTHGDVINSLLADAFGTHLDAFQRITADPGSVSVIRYTQLRPFVLHVNHTGARLSAALRAAPPPKAEPKAEPSAEPQNQPDGAVPSSDAVVGGSGD
jgi:probable phosphomutase (TIGR03848 family)